jgi:hypothetical protein
MARSAAMPATAPSPRIATAEEIRDVIVAQPRRGLPELIETALAASGALLRGHFGLQVGKHTEFFIRFRALARDPAVLDAIAGHLLATLELPPEPVILVPESAGYFLGEAIRARIGGTLAVPALRALKKRIAFTETGGALLAGVDGVVVIAHGRSDTTALKNAVKLADRFARADMPARLGAAVATHV